MRGQDLRKGHGRRGLWSWIFVVLVLTTGSPGTGPLAAQGSVDPLPSFADLTGHAPGEAITTHGDVVRYLQALASSPRVSLLEQGTSWEGRRLLAAVVTAPANHGRLEEIRQGIARLGDPRTTSPEEAARLAAELPAVVWLGGSIHGNELSGTEGLLVVLDELVRGDDPATLEILDELVVIIDPILNPDGRDAFVHANRRTAGRLPNPRRDDWGNDWSFWDALGFRTGHYFFDTNRDWFAHTQLETRNRMPTFRAWRPQVVVDAHEMGSDAEFFFDPATEPYGPHFSAFARRWFERFHGAYADAFDAAGFDYMSRERYNYFYPGYTTSWGSYQGAAGMLYEQGSSRGLAIHRADETVRTLEHALTQQATAARAALELAAGQRQALLEDWHDAHRQDVEAGRTGTVRYLLPPGGDPLHHRELAALLARNGIEVGRLTEPLTLLAVTDRAGRAVGERSFPAGTLVVEAAQPRQRLVRTLLEPRVPIAETFLEEARARVERGENPRFYDITAWSLPLLFDLPAFGAGAGPAPATGPWQPGEVTPEVPPAEYAYLLDGRRAAVMAALVALKEEGLRVSLTLRPTRIAGEDGGERDLASGTGVVWISERDGQTAERVRPAVAAVAQRFRLAVRGMDSGRTAVTDFAPTSFAALGSGDVVPLVEPRVALLAGQPVHGYSFGWAWWVLDRQYEIPLTVRRVESIAGTPLDDFDTLVVPDLFSASGLLEALGEKGKERLARWVEDGGTLVTLGEATEAARHLELITLGSWYPETPGGEDDGSAEPSGDAGPPPIRFTVPGAILAAEVDPEHWLSAGYVPSVAAAGGPVELPVLVGSSRIFVEPEGPPDGRRRAVVRYRAAASPQAPERVEVLSGHAWEESLERLPGAVFAWVEAKGRGRVVAFAEDVNFRGYFRGADRLFLNAVVLGPSAP